MSTYNTFAFGYNMVDDCPCPAMAAGYCPDNGVAITDVAEHYDEIAASQQPDVEGTISEELAKQYWQMAMEEIASIINDETRSDYTREYHQGAWTVGMEVAAELGWEMEDLE